MTITATARRHVVRALREALHVRERHAAFIADWFVNVELLEKRTVSDLRGVRALIVGADSFSPRAALYLDDGRGFEPVGVDLELEPINVERWLRLPIEEAYAIAAEIHQNRGQGMIDADRALEAERAQWAAEAAAERAAFDEIANDDDAGREPRRPVWTNGTVISAEAASSGDHLVVMVETLEGARTKMAMFPLFGDLADLLAYARSQIGGPRLLGVGDVGSLDMIPPSGFDRSTPVLDMIFERDAFPMAA